MTFIFHGVPPRMIGSTLYPLNELEHQHPEVYTEEVKKYRGRMDLMDVRIPPLGSCRWNDVLMLIGVPPEEVRAAYESVGYRLRRPFPMYRFDAATLDHSRMAVLETMVLNTGGEFVPFELKNFDRYTSVPEATFEFWRSEMARGVEKPLLFMHIPHILYRGPLDISQATVVEG